MNFRDTAIASNYSKVLYDEVNYTLGEVHAVKLLDTVVHGTAEFLSKNRDKETPVAVKFINYRNDEFCMACVLRYFEGKGKDPGNWNVTWVFDEKDIPENTRVVTCKGDASLDQYYKAYAGSKYKFGYKFVDSIIILNNEIMYQLRKWLDENASEKEVITVELEDVLIAKVAVEGGEKVFSIELDGEVKNLIKDDAAIEK